MKTQVKHKIKINSQHRFDGWCMITALQSKLTKVTL